jgi:hypothetical protein
MNNLEFSIQPICEACVHFQMESEREIDPDLNEVNPQTMFCKSFPAGIPIEIWQDANPHFRPVGGEKEEGGKPILFKAVEDDDLLNSILQTRKDQIRAENEWIEANAID